MSVTFIRRVIEIIIGLFVIGIVIGAVRAAASLISGSFGKVSWPIASDLPQPIELASTGQLRWTHGDVVLSGQPFAHAFDLVTTIGVLVMMIVAFLALRRILLALAGGELFTPENIADGNGLGHHGNPPRGDHDRQPFHEGPDEFKGETARTNDDRGPEFQHWHPAFSQDFPDLLPAA